MIWPYRSWLFKLYFVVSRLKKSVNFLFVFFFFFSEFSPMFAIKFYRNQGKILYIKCTQGNVLYSIQYGCKCVIDRYIHYPFLLKEPEVLLYVLHCIYYVCGFFFFQAGVPEVQLWNQILGTNSYSLNSFSKYTKFHKSLCVSYKRKAIIWNDSGCC